MALALALVFTLVLCCQPTSATSVRRNITNSQHKSSRENYNSLSSNRPEILPFATESIKSKYIEICQKCSPNGDCESEMRTFCSSPSANCNFHLPILTRDCSNYSTSCTFDHQCEDRWPNSICHFNKCSCKRDFFFNFADQTCGSLNFETEPPFPVPAMPLRDTGDYGKSCYTPMYCPWANMVCQANRCLCPFKTKPDYELRFCKKDDDYISNYKPGDGDYTYVIIVTVGCLLVVFFGIIWICGMMKRIHEQEESINQGMNDVLDGCRTLRDIRRDLESRNQSRSNNYSQPVMSSLAGTSNNLEVADDTPPEYPNVCTIASEEESREENNKLPTYDETVRPIECNPPSLFGVAAPSLEQERNTPPTLGSESDGYINRGYVNYTSQS